jgi:hypothetical protein
VEPEAASAQPVTVDPASRTRRLLVRLGRAALFLLGLLAIFAVLYRVGAPHYQTAKFKQEKRRLAAVPQAEIVIFGNSHALNISPEEGQFRGMNFGRGGQDLFELAHTARYVMPRASQARTVLIGISYFSFSLDNGAFRKRGVQTRIGRRLHTYAAFPRLGLIEGDTGPYLKGLLYPLVTGDHWERIWTGVYDASRADEEDEEVRPKTKLVLRTPAQLESISRRRVRGYLGLMSNMRKNNPEVMNETYETLLELILDLQDRGLTVALFTAPYYAAYSKQFPKVWQTRLSENAKKLSKATGARYHDFSKNSELVDRAELFADGDHLNLDGKKIFSRMIADLPEVRGAR